MPRRRRISHDRQAPETSPSFQSPRLGAYSRPACPHEGAVCVAEGVEEIAIQGRGGHAMKCPSCGKGPLKNVTKPHYAGPGFGGITIPDAHFRVCGKCGERLVDSGETKRWRGIQKQKLGAVVCYRHGKAVALQCPKCDGRMRAEKSISNEGITFVCKCLKCGIQVTGGRVEEIVQNAVDDCNARLQTRMAAL